MGDYGRWDADGMAVTESEHRALAAMRQRAGVGATRRERGMDEGTIPEPEVDTNKVRESLADFDRSHPTQGSCQHERYWRNALPGIIGALDAKDREIERLRAENARLREALEMAIGYVDTWPEGHRTVFRATLAPSDEEPGT